MKTADWMQEEYQISLQVSLHEKQESRLDLGDGLIY